jgi:hypothetical protein
VVIIIVVVVVVIVVVVVVVSFWRNFERIGGAGIYRNILEDFLHSQDSIVELCNSQIVLDSRIPIVFQAVITKGSKCECD